MTRIAMVVCIACCGGTSLASRDATVPVDASTDAPPVDLAADLAPIAAQYQLAALAALAADDVTILGQGVTGVRKLGDGASASCCCRARLPRSRASSTRARSCGRIARRSSTSTWWSGRPSVAISRRRARRLRVMLS